MVKSEPEVKPTDRYSTKETCEILGIHRNTLIRYTASGAIRCGIRRATCRKFYTGSEILRFWKASL